MQKGKDAADLGKEGKLRTARAVDLGKEGQLRTTSNESKKI
jgi:hypothetical protein